MLLYEIKGANYGCGCFMWAVTEWTARSCCSLGKVNLNGVDDHPATNCSLQTSPPLSPAAVRKLITLTEKPQIPAEPLNNPYNATTTPACGSLW